MQPITIDQQTTGRNRKMLKHLLIHYIPVACMLSLAIAGAHAAALGATGSVASSSIDNLSGSPELVKARRDSAAKLGQVELDSQETGHYLPDPGYQSTDSGYGYDSGKNAYGKQASDWSLYDQGKCKPLLSLPLLLFLIAPLAQTAPVYEMID